MKKQFLILFISIAFLSFSSVAKDGYNIRIKATHLQDSIIYLCHYMAKGGMVYKDDSAIVKNKNSASFTFTTNKKIIGGIYMLWFPSNSNNLEFLLDNGADFAFDFDKEKPIQSVRFANNIDNTHFYEYQNFLLGISNTYNKIKTQLAAAKTQKDSVAIDKQSKALSAETNAYRKQFEQKYPNSLATTIFNAIEEPEIPTIIPNLTDGKKDSTYTYHFYKNNYWNTFNFKDDRLIYTPLFDKKLEDYFKLIPPIPDSVNKECDMLLAKTRGTEWLFRYTLMWATSYAEKSKVMGMDESFVYLVENYLMKGDAKWLDDSDYNKIVDRAKKIAPNMIGQTAPDLKIQDINGNLAPLSLYYPQNDYTILCFWSPDCGHCQHEVPLLDSVLKEIRKTVNIKAYAVESEELPEKWANFIKDKKLGNFWLHAHDPNHVSNFVATYDVYMTPVIYLLDNKGKIVGKRIDHSNIEGLVNHLEKMKKQNSSKKS